jgi:hypothetical protein
VPVRERRIDATQQIEVRVPAVLLAASTTARR